MSTQSNPSILVKHINKNVKYSPRKLRLWVKGIRQMSPLVVISRLKLTNTKAARILLKSLLNVVADAKNNFNLDPNSLKFQEIRVATALKP